ncbi:MAG: hypothetical protein ABFS45_22150 [Pseudomonadota bacterium]
MKTMTWGLASAKQALVIGAITASGFVYAEIPVTSAGQPAPVPPSDVPESAPPFGLPGSAPPFGKRIGKGAAIAGVSYHCLGTSEQRLNQGAPYSYLADSMVLDAGGEEAILEGAATGDLVTDNDVLLPTHMAGASISTNGLTLQPFDTCGTSAGSALNAVVVGVNQADASASGAAAVEYHFKYHATLKSQNTGGSGVDFSAFTRTTLYVLGLEVESFKVSASGELIEAPPGLTVTDLSVDDNYVYEVTGTYVVDGGELYYGPKVTNIVQTMFEASGKVTGMEITDSTMVAGFASAEAMNTLTYEIVSLDPNVSFSFVPAQTVAEEASGVASP